MKWYFIVIFVYIMGVCGTVSANPSIIINKNTYTLQLIDNNKTKQIQRVIVGKRSRPTPTMSVLMTHVVIHPKWNVPGKLARLDIVPKIKNNPSVVDRLGYRFFKENDELEFEEIDWSSLTRRTKTPFRIVQDPGPANALGNIKFILNNNRAIFIHGTPNISLFDTPERNYSSGCIRVEYPTELAQYLLPEIDISSALSTSKQERWFKLKTPIKVQITP